MRPITFVFALFCNLAQLGTLQSEAAVVSSMLNASTSAEFDGNADNDLSTLSVGSLQSLANANNSLSRSDLNWNWDGSALSGAGLLTAEKTVSAKPGGDHVVASNFEFSFTLDSAMELAFDGTWGFSNIASSSPDSLGLSLTGSSGTIFSDSTSVSTGTAADTFSFSGTLGPGTYTFSINASLAETINNQGVAQAGWSLGNFHFTAVPEPNAGLTSLMIVFVGLFFRRRQTVAA